MSAQDFEKLQLVILENPALQIELREITDLEDFIFRVIEIGADYGLHFGYEDILQIIRQRRRVWIERWI